MAVTANISMFSGSRKEGGNLFQVKQNILPTCQWRDRHTAPPAVKEAEILLLLLSKLPFSDKTEILSVRKQARVYTNSVFSRLPHYTIVYVLID